MAVIDVLRHLSTYLAEAHKNGSCHLADIYELVQYAGNIIPRLYLMTTVGSVYMAMDDAPVKEIMKDLMEMHRGVQHPLRGLFLRNYLSSQTRESLPTGDGDGPGGNIQDSIDFTLTNFIEMNKLWVRMQHQGPSRERQQREQERRELRILVGTNLVRLSELIGNNLELHQTVVLPAVLEQIIQCHDPLAQENLMEVIAQVFTDELHLYTLDEFLSVLPQLNPSVNVRQLVTSLIDRLAGFASREIEDENPEEKNKKEEDEMRKMESRIRELRLHSNRDVNDVSSIEKVNDGAIAPAKPDPNAKTFRGIPENVKLFEIFWNQLVKLVQTRPDLPILDVTSLLVSLCNLALNCYPAKIEYVDQILLYAEKTINDNKDKPDLHQPATQNNLLSLMLAPLSCYPRVFDVLALSHYITVLEMLSYDTRCSVASAVIHSVLKNETQIQNKEDAEGVLQLIQVLINEENKNPSKAIGSTSKNAADDTAAEEQGWVAKLVHYFYDDDTLVQYDILQIYKRVCATGGERIKYTYPALITKFLRLARRICRLQSEDWRNQCQQSLKAVNNCLSLLNDVPGCADLCLRLYTFAGQVADQVQFEDSSYEFFAEAFSVYDDSITESKAQFQSLMVIMSALHSTRNFSTDNYDTLINKCAKHGSKLLQKPAQCRAVYSASHLWWAIEHPGRPEEDEKNLYYDGQRVLECLQKSLKIADACMDQWTSVELFIEVLNRYIYYADKGNESVSFEFVNLYVFVYAFFG